MKGGEEEEEEGKEEGEKKKRKRCVIIHTISSRCKKRPEAFASRGTSAAAATPPKKRRKKKPLPFTRRHQGSGKKRRPLTHGGHNYWALKLCLSTHASRQRTASLPDCTSSNTSPPISTVSPFIRAWTVGPLGLTCAFTLRIALIITQKQQCGKSARLFIKHYVGDVAKVAQ